MTKYEILLCDKESGVIEEIYLEATSVWTAWDALMERDLPSGVASVNLTPVEGVYEQ